MWVVKQKRRCPLRYLLCPALVLITAPLTPACAFAQVRTFRFDIPPQSLDSALRRYAQISGQQLAYDSQVLEGKTSHRLQGELGAAPALETLLDGTGLAALQLPSGVYRINVIPAAPVGKLPDREQASPAPAAHTVIDPGDGLPPPVVIVVGERPQDGISYHRHDLQLRDAVTAREASKLPAGNVPEVLQHVGGTQAGLDRGEVNSINIRGLSEINTLINGREVYSDTGRNLALEYVPTNIFADLDIYKNPSAAMIEGGVGGIVDMRTRRPLESQSPIYGLTLRRSTYEHSPRSTLQETGTFSRNWHTGRGDFGLLFSFANLPSVARIDSIASEPFASRYDLVDRNGNGRLPGLTPPAPGADAGDMVIAPQGGGDASERTTRNRTAADIVGQWRPSGNLLFTGEITRLAYKFSRDAYVLYANRGPLQAQPGVNFIFSGDPGEGNVIQAGGYRDVVFTSNTNYYDRKTASNQYAFSVDWTVAPLTRITADVSHTRSTRNDDAGGLRIGNADHAAGTTLTFDLRPDLPLLHLSGVNPANPDIYSLVDSSHSIAFAESSGDALRADVAQSLNAGVLRNIDFGVRWSTRKVLSEAGTRQHLAGDLPASLLPQATAPVPVTDFFHGKVAENLFDQGVLAAPPSLVRHMATICKAVHDTVCVPEFEPSHTYSARETTGAAYGQLTYEFTVVGLLVSGTTGVRIVRTDRVIQGYQTSNNGFVTPFFTNRHETDVLPSASARVTLAPALYLRLAVGKQVTRPSFSDLSPSLTFGYANANSTLTGFAGNPGLRPLRSTSFDASLEYYLSGTGYVYATAFRKDIDGFIQAVVRVEPVSFPDFPGYTTAEITRLQNGERGVLTGYQAGFQSSLRHLGPLFSELTVQANYTRVNSDAPGPIAGTSVPLVGLSRNSFNLMLAYEHASIRANLSYVYRDDYVDTIAGPGSGSLPIYSRPYGSIDMSIGYHINKATEISLEGANLGHARQASYFGQSDRPRFVNAGESRLSIVLRLSN